MIPNRPNKLSKGLTIQMDNDKKRGKKVRYSDDFNTLSVKGTLDKIGRSFWLNRKRVIIKHPTDFGFYKEAFVLSDSGKLRLKNKRREKLKP